MPAPFKQITREQFAELLSKFPFKRKINAVHMHHTWRPNRSNYRGHDTIVAMWRFHTEHNHWSDIAQHITIAPDGSIWLGRDWNRPPASASGHNGNEQAGPFMFEMIGDFDEGKDPFDGEQRRTALEVIARVQLRFGLPPGTLQFHNMMSTKSCPGTGIDYQTVLHDVAELHPQLLGSTRGAPPVDGPFPEEQLATRQVVREAIESLQRATQQQIDPPDAEPCFQGKELEEWADGAARDGRAIDLDAAARQALRPHVVNLRMGLFSSSGDWTSTAGDVDAIFDDYLTKALNAARAETRKLKLMFYAHGGLTSEDDALLKARDLVGWWKANGIYPIHFVWETGLCETLGQMLERARQGRDIVTRNFFSDHVSDPLIEDFAHRAGGVQIWGAMKWSAQQSSAANALGGDPGAASASPGGARYVATRLAAFCKAHPDDVEVHACGHSAGAIFHAHFIPCALELGVPQFQSLHLMAPAVRVDLFRQQLEERVGKGRGIEKLTMYTMEDSLERSDNCGEVYRKSLLYLIYKALEPEVDEPILGLERCVRGDVNLKRLFGIGDGPTSADVVWSDNGLSQGRSASRSHSHGGFDDDPATMGSIVRRVLGKADADLIVELPGTRRVVNPWDLRVDPWADVLARHDIELPTPSLAQPQPQPQPSPDWQSSILGFASPAPQRPVGAGMAGYAGNRRVALCVGIDSYPSAPLGGCVNDARAWADALTRLGFGTPSTLFNQQATRDAIVQQLTALVAASRSGDVIVFQYAGHGTQVPDLDGDELGGDTPGEDEAICPYDFASGNLVIDDDMRIIFGNLPDGVNLTCFFDCCHSGTITRFAGGD
ncbi:MAG: caspase family protein, partial [Burkholderiaceae bacterium]